MPRPAPVSPDWLPAPDAALSPHTGWTRDHHVAVLERMLAACRANATPSGAQVHFPGTVSHSGRTSDGFEGFARSFMGAAFRVAGEPDEAGGSLAWYASGFAAGTDPAHPEAWPAPADHGQAIVESAAVALGLGLTREVFFDHLPETTRTSIVRYLSQVTGKTVPDNNWWLFDAIVDELLLAIDPDAPAEVTRAREEEVERAFDRLEGWYLGDGWYTDGGETNFDHYVGWALHFYPLLWTRMAARRVPGRAAALAETFRARLGTFLEQAVHLVGGDGAPMHQGRSLVYRFATVAPFLVAQVEGVPGLTPGQTRHLASSTLRYFVDQGALEPDGHPSVGWFGPFQPLAQVYSGPASPLWATKGLVGLALPPEHPLWSEPEEPLDQLHEPDVRTLAVPGFVVARTAQGVVRLANHGSDHFPSFRGFDDPFYTRLAYSTHTSVVPSENLEDHVALLRDGAASYRSQIHRVGAPGPDHGTLSSAHHPVWTAGESAAGGPFPWRVLTTTRLVPGVEVRVHRITGPDAAADGAATTTPGVTGVREGGPAVAGQALDEAGSAVVAGGPAAWARSGGLVGWVVGAHGWDGADASVATGRATAYGPASGTPVLTRGAPDDGVTTLVTVVGLDLLSTPLDGDDAVAVLSGTVPAWVPSVGIAWADADGRTATAASATSVTVTLDVAGRRTEVRCVLP